MKANVFALVGLSFISLLPAQAANNQINPANAIEAKQNLNAKINLNKADAITLSKAFKGIGKKRAEAIVHYRETHSGFKSIEELAKVRGLGKQFVQKHLAGLKAKFAIS